MVSIVFCTLSDLFAIQSVQKIIGWLVETYIVRFSWRIVCFKGISFFYIVFKGNSLCDQSLTPVGRTEMAWRTFLILQYKLLGPMMTNNCSHIPQSQGNSRFCCKWQLKSPLFTRFDGSFEIYLQSLLVTGVTVSQTQLFIQTIK